MIRFSAALVVVAIGVLIGGVAASSLLLVYLAIGVSAVALAVLVTGIALKRDELFTSDTGSRATGVGTLGTGMGTVQQAASGGLGGEARLPAAAGASTLGGASSQQDAFAGKGTGAPWSSPQAPAPPWAAGAWPPPEPGFPSAPASGQGTESASGTSSSGPAAPEDRSSVFTPSSRRRAPMAPPTRADPVVPWADALPTRSEIGKVNSPESAESETTRVERIIPAETTRIEQVERVNLAETTRIERVERINLAETTRIERVISPADGAGADEPPGDDSGAAEQASDARLTAAFGLGHEDVETPAVADDAAAADEIDVAPGITVVEDVDGISDETAAVAEVPADATATTPVPDAEVSDSDVPGGEVPDAEVPDAEPVSGRVTVVPGVPRYHHDDCILVRFLDDGDVVRVSVAEAEKSGCTPCRACHPED